MLSKTFIQTCTFFFFAITSLAQAQEILKVTRSDMPERRYTIHAVTNDEGDLENIRLVIKDPDEKFAPRNFTIPEMKSASGAVIDRVKVITYEERIATSMNAHSDFNGKSGGSVTFLYLAHFGDNLRLPIELKLLRTGQSWAVYKKANNQLIRQIDFTMGGFGTGRGAKSYDSH